MGIVAPDTSPKSFNGHLHGRNRYNHSREEGLGSPCHPPELCEPPPIAHQQISEQRARQQDGEEIHQTDEEFQGFDIHNLALWFTVVHKTQRQSHRFPRSCIPDVDMAGKHSSAFTAARIMFLACGSVTVPSPKLSPVASQEFSYAYRSLDRAPNDAKNS